MRRISQRQLARDIGITYQWLSMVLNGHVKASPALRGAIAGRLNMPADELFRPEVRS
jgi:transcriptional regulator with XRE-family HTH domain